MAGPAPVEDLDRCGWRYRDGWEVSAEPDAYQRYIRTSRGEWSVAKNGYVKLRTGWFSDRSASYLATGRPVVVQSTGFADWLPTGSGVISFSTVGEAVSALENAEADYERHCAAARDIAVAVFDSSKVLAEIVRISMA
jgi:hypothetical protein